MASYVRRKAGIAAPAGWRHPAFTCDTPALRAAATHAQQLGEAHGWNSSTLLLVLDGLTTVLQDRPADEHVRLTDVRTRTPRHASTPRVAEVLADLGLLDDDTTPAIRAWIDRRTSELPVGFVDPVRAWLLVLLDGGPRARPRSHVTLYVYFGTVRPFIQQWSSQYGHLREISTGDLDAVLDPLRGHRRHTAVTALRSLFRFAKKQGMIFNDPTRRLRTVNVASNLVPMTDAELRAVEQIVVDPARRLIVALAAVHAARAAAIEHLTVDDLDLPNRRITIAGHPQRLGDLTHQALQTWLEHRRTRWPHTPNPHVLVSGRTALGTDPVSKSYIHFHLRRHGVDLDRIRKDAILHEALATGADPLHLALVFNLSHTTASRYATIAEHLLGDQLEHASTAAQAIRRPDELTASPGSRRPRPVGSE